MKLRVSILLSSRVSILLAIEKHKLEAYATLLTVSAAKPHLYELCQNNVAN